MTLSFSYYEIVNTVNEIDERVTARWDTFEHADADLENHADWYCYKGTGRIDRTDVYTNGDGSVLLSRETVKQVTQYDLLHADDDEDNEN